MRRFKAEEEEFVGTSQELKELLSMEQPSSSEVEVVAEDNMLSDAKNDSDRSAAFLHAARRGACAEVSRILEDDHTLLLAADGDGNTALHLAAMGAHDELVGQLLNVSEIATLIIGLVQ